MAPGRQKRRTPPGGGVGAPVVARLEPYRPRCRAGVGTLAAFHQVAGRIVGPEPSAPLWIRMRLLWTEKFFRSSLFARPPGDAVLINIMTDDALLAAYRQTRFCADTELGRVVIRVGEVCPALDALLRARGCRTWAYITAFNPGSVRVSDEQNFARQRELEDAVRQLGDLMFPGEGIGADGTWRPERSILILGIDRAAAMQLGRRFGQRTIVWGELAGPATLVFCT